MADDHGGNIQKINAAYEIGKAKMAKKTVSQFLGLPIDYSVTVDMGALKELVDFVGGITIDTVIDVNLNGQVIPQGHHHLNGDQALAYSRMRYQDLWAAIAATRSFETSCAKNSKAKIFDEHW